MEKSILFVDTQFVVAVVVPFLILIVTIKSNAKNVEKTIKSNAENVEKTIKSNAENVEKTIKSNAENINKRINLENIRIEKKVVSEVLCDFKFTYFENFLEQLQIIMGNNIYNSTEFSALQRQVQEDIDKIIFNEMRLILETTIYVKVEGSSANELDQYRKGFVENYKKLFDVTYSLLKEMKEDLRKIYNSKKIEKDIRECKKLQIENKENKEIKKILKGLEKEKSRNVVQGDLNKYKEIVNEFQVERKIRLDELQKVVKVYYNKCI